MKACQEIILRNYCEGIRGNVNGQIAIQKVKIGEVSQILFNAPNFHHFVSIEGFVSDFVKPKVTVVNRNLFGEFNFHNGSRIPLPL